MEDDKSALRIREIQDANVSEPVRDSEFSYLPFYLPRIGLLEKDAVTGPGARWS